LGENARNVHVKITDIGTPKNLHKPENVKHILYDEVHGENPYEDDYHVAARENIYGRIWQFDFYSNAIFHRFVTFEKPFFILVIGLLIELLLVTLFLRLAKENLRIERIAQEQTTSLLKLFENAVDGMVTIDKYGKISSINPACEKMFGYTSKEIIGLGRTVEGLRKNGTVFPLELSVSESQIEGKTIYTGILRDITERQKYQTDLVQANDYLSLAEELAQLGHWRVDLEKDTLFWSNEVFKIHERAVDERLPTLEEAISFYHKDDVAHVKQNIDDAIKTGIGFTFEHRIITAKGQLRYVRSVGHTQKNADGKVHALFGIVQDITTSKARDNEFENLSAFYKTILDTVPDKVFVKDSELRIIEANKAFWSMYDKPPEELLGTTTLEKFPKEQAEGFMARDKAVLNGNKINETEENITTAEGKTISHYTRKIPFDSPLKGRVLLGLAQDITERRQAEEAQEILIQKLSVSNEELEKFAFVASHDLQEPLRMVSSFSQVLQEDYVDSLPKTAQSYLKLIHEGANRMQDLVNDMLDYARLSNREADVDRIFQVDDTFKIVQENLHEAIEESNATVAIANNLPKVLHGNHSRFVRVTQNIIGNAIKYQQTDTKPHIKVSFKTEDDFYIFSIKDNGIGMKKEHWNKVFNPFQRLHAKSEYSGTGIGLNKNHTEEVFRLFRQLHPADDYSGCGAGLTLCQKIMQLHGGNIIVQPQPEGLKVLLTFPHT